MVKVMAAIPLTELVVWSFGQTIWEIYSEGSIHAISFVKKHLEKSHVDPNSSFQEKDTMLMRLKGPRFLDQTVGDSISTTRVKEEVTTLLFEQKE